MKIQVSYEDDFLYSQLIRLCEQVKLVQGATALNSTLRRHSKIKSYLIQKQVEQLSLIESRYFTNDGLNDLAIKSHNLKNTIVH